MGQLDPAPGHLSARELKAAMALRDIIQQNSTMAPFLMLRSSRRLLNLLVGDRWPIALRSVAHLRTWVLTSQQSHKVLAGLRCPWDSVLPRPSLTVASCQDTSGSAHYEKVSIDSRLLLSSCVCITWATRLHINSCPDLADASASRSPASSKAEGLKAWLRRPN